MMLRAAVLVAAACSAIASGQTPLRDTAPPGASTLRGHVFAADIGQPLRNAQVQLIRLAEVRQSATATTEATGRTMGITGMGPPSRPAARIAADGTFDLRSAPGRVRLFSTSMAGSPGEWRIQAVRFRTDHLLTLQVWLPKTKYPEPAHARRFYDQLLRRIARLPGVHGAGAISFRPFLG